MLIIHAMIFSDEHLAENECSFCLFPKELDMIPLQKKKKIARNRAIRTLLVLNIDLQARLVKDWTLRNLSLETISNTLLAVFLSLSFLLNVVLKAQPRV